MPGSRVFARAPDAISYSPGLLTSVDKRMSVIMDDASTTWSYDVNDVRGVVLDQTPLIKEIAVNQLVIALIKEGEPMKVGVVTKVIQGSVDQEEPTIFIRFSAEQEEEKPLDLIRLIKNVNIGGIYLKFFT